MDYNQIKKIRLCISYYCDLKCQHCYVPKTTRQEFSKLESQQISVDRIKEMLDYMIDNFGLNTLDITGGEPLNKKVWERTKPVVSYALSKGLNIQLNTSGSGNVDFENLYEIVKDYKDKFTLHVSLDGIDEQMVDNFRGVQGAMKRALTLLHKAIDNGIFLRIRLTITKDNYKDVLNTYKFVSELGVSAFMCKPVNSSGTALENSEITGLTEENVKQVQKEIVEFSINNKTRLDLPAPHLVDTENFTDKHNILITRCLCGAQLFYLAFNGDVYPCTYMCGAKNNKDYILCNLQECSFDEFSKLWLKPDTYASFRNMEKHVCRAHEILKSKVDLCDITKYMVD